MSKGRFNEGMFVNCFYTFPNKALKKPDSIIMVTKKENGEKEFKYIPKPKFSFYTTKDEYNDGKLVDFIPFDKCKKITCEYNKRYSEMVKSTNNPEVKSFYNNIIKNQRYKELNELNLFPEFHESDINIVDYYIKEFINEYDYRKYNYDLNITAFDIEVDSSNIVGFPDENEALCPVNMISMYNNVSNTLYLYALKYDTDTFIDFKNHHIKESCMYIFNKYKKYFGDFKIKPVFFNTELALISTFFKQINTDKPDYVFAWNARFDIQTLHNRLIKLLAGKEIFPEDIMCPEEFPVKRVNIKLDTSPDAETDFSKRADLFEIYGYSNWGDMMALYANITRPNGKKDSYSLDAIGEEETGETKEDLSVDDTNIKTAHLDNYSAFFKYSGGDSLLLMLIINKTGHVNILHSISTMTRTRPSKALKKTVCLRNFGQYFYNLNGYAMSNNHSYLKPQDGHIAGALTYKCSLNLVNCWKLLKLN